MSPRPYRLRQRRAASERTRARIIAAARTLIMASSGGSFSIDAVAREAGVARMTVYYQFASKRGLLEALFDDLAARGLIDRLPAAFERPDPLDALDGLIGAFTHFWASERVVIRRVRALAALDPDFDEAVRARDERRRNGLRVILERLAGASGRPAGDSLNDPVDILHALTSFETFDALAEAPRRPEEVESLVRRLSRSTLGLDAG